MEGNILDGLVLEQGKSEELRAALDCLRDASAADGGPRYSEKVCRDVARAVVCRSYARPILELSHMIVAAGAGDGGFEDIFWGVERATGATFHRCFAELAKDAPSIICGTTALKTTYADGNFEISYSRMPFLAALLEFLVGAIGYGEIDAATKIVRKGDGCLADVSGAAAQLSRRLYEFLKIHLPSQQARKRERHFLEYVNRHRPDMAAADAIDDQITLDYWRTHAGNDDQELRTYKTVHETACRLIVALDAAVSRLAASRAQPIGASFADGEVDPADVEWVTAALDEGVRTVADIVGVIDERLNFLTGTELEILAQIPAAEAVQRQLPRSVVRAAVFGAQQARIGNIVRFHRQRSELERLCRLEGIETYSSRIAVFEETVSTIRGLLLAALAILHESGHESAVELAMFLAPETDWGQLAGRARMNDTVVQFDAVAALRQFLGLK